MIARFFTFALVALAAACGPGAPTPPRCELVAEARVDLTAPGAADRVTARSFGPTCEEAILLYAVTTADGEAIWAWSGVAQRAFGEAMRGGNTDTMQSFLDRWVSAQVERASAAPPWPLIGDAAVTLERATYEDIRARDLPVLCHLSGVARETCVFWEPAAGGAGHFYERDAQDAGGAPEPLHSGDEDLVIRSEDE